MPPNVPNEITRDKQSVIWRATLMDVCRKMSAKMDRWQFGQRLQGPSRQTQIGVDRTERPFHAGTQVSEHKAQGVEALMQTKQACEAVDGSKCVTTEVEGPKATGRKDLLVVRST